MEKDPMGGVRKTMWIAMLNGVTEDDCLVYTNATNDRSIAWSDLFSAYFVVGQQAFETQDKALDATLQLISNKIDKLTFEVRAAQTEISKLRSRMIDVVRENSK